MKSNDLILIVSAPSGAGKTTLIERLRKELRMRFVVSHTTRAQRATEANGSDYHFVDDSTFKTMVMKDEFAEWARVHGSFYGTSLAEIAYVSHMHTGTILDVDWQGARQIKARIPDAVSVFVVPPSMRELERRLTARGTETSESLKTRIGAAAEEMKHYAMYDYVVVNENLGEAYEALSSIAVAETCRTRKRSQACESIIRGDEIK
ncbi:MAG: Guanylate kinase [Synergistetes bacterium ADurb.BinA166]|nr:MAG: Guanylate kinase [Synergistetes bacterium ADurb.BinA166]